MDEKVDQDEVQKMVVPKLNIVTDINSKRGSSRSPAVSPRGTPLLQKTSSVKMNCLCAPTTHAGSFRCRFHRNKPGLTRNSASLGSNLCDLGSDKSSSIRSDSPLASCSIRN